MPSYTNIIGYLTIYIYFVSALDILYVCHYMLMNRKCFSVFFNCKIRGLNMSKIIAGAVFMTALSLSASTGFAETKPPIQDSAKAAEYFEYVIEVTTNPFLTKKVVDGEVKDVTIVDLRSPEDFKKGHIPGAINIANIKEGVTDFPGLRKDGYNYLYGYSDACLLPQINGKRFAKLGFPVKAMKGGFNAWIEYEYPVEK
jgi:hypothetical protein